MRRGIYRGLHLLLIAVLAINTLVWHPQPSHAAGTLDDPRDVISSVTPNARNVTHDISFTLPSDATQVTTRDFILVTMPNFSDAAAFVDHYGGFGTPVYFVSDHTIQITNLAILPGTTVGFFGATATNPAPGGDFNVTISIAKGSARGLIVNEFTVDASINGYYTNVSATIQSPLSSLSVSGFTSPNAFVTMTEGITVVGTTTAQGDGAFSFSLSGADPGDHTFNVTSTDGNGRTTSAAAVSAYLITGTLTSVSGILLSPAISLDKTAISAGDTLTVSGTAMPSSLINIFTESPLRSYPTTTNDTGNFSYTIPGSETSAYAPGDHRAYAIVQDDIGNQSLTSPTINFTVNSSADTANPAPACNISHGDLNCDHKTNLTDFSILLFHWKTNHKLADINNDGAVNLTDFSIMMFYFQR